MCLSRKLLKLITKPFSLICRIPYSRQDADPPLFSHELILIIFWKRFVVELEFGELRSHEKTERVGRCWIGGRQFHHADRGRSFVRNIRRALVIFIIIYMIRLIPGFLLRVPVTDPPDSGPTPRCQVKIPTPTDTASTILEPSQLPAEKRVTV